MSTSGGNPLEAITTPLVTTAGNLQLSPASGVVDLHNTADANAATAGAAAALPATPAGYAVIAVDGNPVKFPFYAI